MCHGGIIALRSHSRSRGGAGRHHLGDPRPRAVIGYTSQELGLQLAGGIQHSHPAILKQSAESSKRSLRDAADASPGGSLFRTGGHHFCQTVVFRHTGRPGSVAGTFEVARLSGVHAGTWNPGAVGRSQALQGYIAQIALVGAAPQELPVAHQEHRLAEFSHAAHQISHGCHICQILSEEDDQCLNLRKLNHGLEGPAQAAGLHT
mmetsp:Transcript_101905/g.242948  ORF Transcript_101905/g.242948 Transcript_101905/m.242948 type:complete len:205 (-) Transcript_101905:932-1546(-)